LILYTLDREHARGSDHAIMTSGLKWKIETKLEIYMPVKSLSFSTIGDFFLITGERVLNIWKKDETVDGFNSELMYSTKKELLIPSKTTKVLDEKDIGLIQQSDITVDGRLIVTLEQGAKTLRIWFNAYSEEA